MKKILLAGSPCTYWSIIQNPDNRETTAEGLGWELFKNYLIAKEKFKPDFFLYENNESISKKIQAQIEKELGVKLNHLNSASVAAQMRKRIYATNVQVPELEDRKISIADIIEEDVEPVVLTRPRFKEKQCRIYTEKSPTITAAGGGEHIPRLLLKGHSLQEINPNTYKDISRTMTVKEVERLQTMPEGYTSCLSKTRAMNALGNGWTAEMIIHIMKCWGIPTDEELVVMSMYDGVATGRYCFEKLGYTKVKYFAYEIDDYPIKCALENYPEIIQCGDAYQVRNADWRIN